MKYIVRAVKYFFYFCILLSAMLAILSVAHVIEGPVEGMFREGYDSLIKIAIMFACVSAVYPLFGFMKKEALIPGEYGEIRDRIIKYMESRGYRLESERDEDMTFRSRSAVTRLLRMFEDRITLTRRVTGFDVEGLRKDVVRIVYGLESALRRPEETTL